MLVRLEASIQNLIRMFLKAKCIYLEGKQNLLKPLRNDFLKHSKDEHSYIQTTVLIQFPS